MMTMRKLSALQSGSNHQWRLTWKRIVREQSAERTIAA